MKGYKFFLIDNKALYPITHVTKNLPKFQPAVCIMLESDKFGMQYEVKWPPQGKPRLWTKVRNRHIHKSFNSENAVISYLEILNEEESKRNRMERVWEPYWFPNLEIPGCSPLPPMF